MAGSPDNERTERRSSMMPRLELYADYTRHGSQPPRKQKLATYM